MHSALRPDVDAFGLEDVFDGDGDVFVLAGDEARHLFDDGDFAAEAAVHLPELEADVAAADDDEMLRQEVDLEHGGVGEVLDLIDAGHVGDAGAAADVDEDLRRLRGGLRRLGPSWRIRTRVAGVDGAVGHGAQAVLDAGAGFEEDLFLAGFDGFHVDGDSRRGC